MLATKEVPDIGSTEQSLISHADQFKRFRKTEHMRANSRLGGTHCKEQATHDYIFRFNFNTHASKRKYASYVLSLYRLLSAQGEGQKKDTLNFISWSLVTKYTNETERNQLVAQAWFCEARFLHWPATLVLAKMRDQTQPWTRGPSKTKICKEGVT